MALGRRLAGTAVRDPGVRFVAGAAALSMAVFVLCTMRLAYPAVFLTVGAVALIWGFRWRPAKVEWRYQPSLYYLLFLIAGFYFVLYFFNSMAPESSFDGAGYHLGFVARSLREHGFQPIAWNLYDSLSQGAEMVFLYAFAFGQHSAASMVHFAFLVALAWQVFAYGRRAGFAVAGACGALLVFVSPMMGVDGTSAYIDVALAAVLFTLFYLLQIWDDARSPRLLVMIGMMAGFAYGVKYTGWPAIPYALGFVLWRSRRWRDGLTVSVFAAGMVLPWMLRNAIWIGNPLAPFFNRWFPNPYITPAFESSYLQHFQRYDLARLWQIPLQVTTYGHLGGLLGPVFLLAPLALLALGRQQGRRLLLAALVFGIGYFSNIGTRFLIPSLPFVALAMALALESVPRLAVALVLVHALISWPTRVSKYCAPDAWHLVRVPFRQALRIKPMDEYLENNTFFYGVARMVDANTPPEATVFTWRPIPESYTSRRILVQYESEPNQVAGVMIEAASFPSEAPNWRIRFAFPRQELTAVRLVTANRGHVLWRIHEVDVADSDRRVEFRCGSAEAHDGNPITFWRSPEWLAPRQTFEMDFLHAAPADEVRIQTSLDQRDVKLRLEGRDRSVGWRLLSDTPEAHQEAGPDMRRDAAEELKNRGIGYLLSFENEGETRDLRLHPELWGVREVAHNKDARLYRLP